MDTTASKTLRRTFAKGFTLLELMISIAILAILLGIGIPSFIDIIRSNQISSQTNVLITSLALARSEATKRGIPVTLCTGTTTTCSGSTDWSNGWLVFADVNGDGAIDTGDVLLQSSSTPPAGLNVAAKDASATARASLTYQRTGENNVVTKFTISKSGCGKQQQRQVTVELSGRSHLEKQDCM